MNGYYGVASFKPISMTIQGNPRTQQTLWHITIVQQLRWAKFHAGYIIKCYFLFNLAFTISTRSFVKSG